MSGKDGLHCAAAFVRPLSGSLFVTLRSLIPTFCIRAGVASFLPCCKRHSPKRLIPIAVRAGARDFVKRRPGRGGAAVFRRPVPAQ